MTEIPSPPISRREREIAIKVLMQSQIVRNWVKAEAAFFNIKHGTPEWNEFYARNARKAAQRLIR